MTDGPQRVRRLEASEIESYDHLSPALAKRVRVVKIPALPGQYVGITLGTLVILQTDEPTDGSSSLLAHELVHVRQWDELGTVRFLGSYLGAFGQELARRRRWSEAYRAIPAESEARDVATQWARRRHRRHETGQL